MVDMFFSTAVSDTDNFYRELIPQFAKFCWSQQLKLSSRLDCFLIPYGSNFQFQSFLKML